METLGGGRGGAAEPLGSIKKGRGDGFNPGRQQGDHVLL